ncbi:MAG: DNA mismatch endonuclease Vsr [Candidatus Binataceae bacterium]|nr:DNA mismatch endonuclease Vsr [Candidatus Binataceae bacterium]
MTSKPRSTGYRASSAARLQLTRIHKALPVADTVDRATRSRMMAGIRAKDTQPEMRVRRAIHSAGLRFRLHRADLPGKPDLVFPSTRRIILVQGCFWHGHRCLKGRIPADNRKYWKEKILSNRARDKRNIRRLRSKGWKVAQIWECTVRKCGEAELLSRLLRVLRERG